MGAFLCSPLQSGWLGSRKIKAYGMAWALTGGNEPCPVPGRASASWLSACNGAGAFPLILPMLVSANAAIDGTLFLRASTNCSPQAGLSETLSLTAFILTHWRSGVSGTLCMGIEHGAYCVGCCCS